MSQDPGAPGEQPRSGDNGALPPGKDQAWISALVDNLVPKFQGQGSASANDAGTQDNQRGKIPSSRAVTGRCF
ncbi:hypothetical protein PtA15_14A242 [Puccinia triticina]|uniref:Uncharacterized protein n=1 Tax=Puccinia triticina TaxID=208348 RepID=A0ABY7D3G2_9BASI|nr:uncharacterized protein PtA15_14A242 [Puccinia triticina]WAQ91359.1 hypothetical protein PtA15_14A242 [Puccinia triticina]